MKYARLSIMILMTSVLSTQAQDAKRKLAKKPKQNTTFEYRFSDDLKQTPDSEAVRLYGVIGNWMKLNSESLLDTRPNPLPERPVWGDVSASKDGNVLYLHILSWPERGTIALSESPVNATKAIYLADGKNADFTQDDRTLNFSLPPEPVNEYDTVIKVTLAESLNPKKVLAE